MNAVERLIWDQGWEAAWWRAKLTGKLPSAPDPSATKAHTVADVLAQARAKLADLTSAEQRIVLDWLEQKGELPTDAHPDFHGERADVVRRTAFAIAHLFINNLRIGEQAQAQLTGVPAPKRGRSRIVP